MKKGVLPLPHIIALIFGVILIGLFGYWLATQGGKTISSGSKAECQSKLFQYCLTLREGSPDTNLWDKKCNDIIGITTPFPSIDDCP